MTFTGDQLGTLFGYHVFETYKESGKPIGKHGIIPSTTSTYHYLLDKLAMVASTVSSKMIEAMAQIEGFRFVDCLTGARRTNPSTKHSKPSVSS